MTRANPIHHQPQEGWSQRRRGNEDWAFPSNSWCGVGLGSLAQNQDTVSGSAAISEKRGDASRKVTFWCWDAAHQKTLPKKNLEERFGIWPQRAIDKKGPVGALSLTRKPSKPEVSKRLNPKGKTVLHFGPWIACLPTGFLDSFGEIQYQRREIGPCCEYRRNECWALRHLEIFGAFHLW